MNNSGESVFPVDQDINAEGPAPATDPMNLCSGAQTSAVIDSKEPEPILETPENGVATETQQDQHETETRYQTLLSRRELYGNLFEQAYFGLKEGQRYFGIPNGWLKTFLNGEFDNDDTDIDSKIGPIDTASLLDGTGLCLDSRQAVDFVAEPIFGKLVEWYGLKTGSVPIERLLFMDKQDGQYKLETYPLYIIPHLLCASAESVNRYRLASAKPFLISGINTARDLKLAMKRQFDITKSTTRIWKIKGNNNTRIPTILTPRSLDVISSKTLIPAGKKSGPLQLNEINVQSGNILIEIQQDDGSYVMDTSSVLTLSSGMVGLNNLGNTCYMNSALQCLVHIPELSHYFLHDFFDKELNTDNPLGNDGKVAASYASLVKHLFDRRLVGGLSSYSPREFKGTLGYYNSMFSDYHQQDSQELIAFLLDGLHEDLNRILKKPYVEKPELPDSKVNDPEEVRKFAEECWDAHKLRNDSVIIDLFVGMYKSTLVCPECNKISITFDPYNDLTLPLPINKKWTGRVNILLEEGFPKLFEVELNKSSTFADLKAYISEKLNVPMHELLVIETFQSQVYKNFEAKDSDTRYLPISDLIGSNDDIWFHQIKHRPGDMVIPVFSTLGGNRTSASPKAFGIPFFITVSEEEKFSYGAIREKLEQRYSQLSTYAYFQQIRSQSKVNHSLEDFPLLNNGSASLEDDDAKSDISLANPDLPGNYAFSIKLFDSTREVRAQHRYSRYLYNGYGSQRYQPQEEDDEDDSLWIPRTNNNFRGLPDLLERLSRRKRAFYTYQGVVSSDEIETNDVVQETDDNGVVEVEPLKEEGSDGSEELSDQSETESTALQPLSMDLDASRSTKERSASEEEEEEVVDATMLEGQEPNNVNESLEEELDSKPLLQEKTALVCEWDPQLFDTFFTGIEEEGEGGKETWSSPEVLRNFELEENRKKLAETLKKNITLDDCLQMFSKSEVLGENDLWYCPNCEEHRQATKEIQIWSVPDILTIHLKRFENTKSFSDKIDAVVDFPIEGLDMSQYVVDNQGQTLIYDLFAVDNHYGGLGGGHYTAYVKNFVDNKWYYYDDSMVSSANPVDSIKGSAYLLFYRKRSLEPLGGEFFQKMFDSIRQEKEDAFRLRKELELKLDEVQQADTGLDESPTPIDVVPSNGGLSRASTSTSGSHTTTDIASDSTDQNVPEDPCKAEKVSCDLAEIGSSDNLFKRRKKMFKKGNILDSNIGSPCSDLDDNVSTYSGSALAPSNVANSNDDIYSDL